ncbi:MAG: aminoglycoside phosphotransferase family protein, partial [Planctomycetota bacterium]
MDISPEQAARRFRIDGEVIDVAPQVAGHIHDSFIVTAREACGRKRYLLQRLNTTVFPRPAEVMENIRRVLEHLRGKLAAVAAPDIERRVLTLVPATAGA